MSVLILTRPQLIMCILFQLNHLKLILSNIADYCCILYDNKIVNGTIFLRYNIFNKNFSNDILIHIA